MCAPDQAIAGVLGGRGAGRLRLPDAPRAAGGGPPGTTPLQHFLYKAPARGQFVMPAFSSPLTVPSLQQARFFTYHDRCQISNDAQLWGLLP